MPLNKSYEECQILDLIRTLELLHTSQSFERLICLTNLENIQALENFEVNINLTLTKSTYNKVTMKENSVIYCDPPYKNTDDYFNDFDYSEFYEWLRKQSNKVFISEYNMPNDFTEIWQKRKYSLLSRYGSNLKVIEKLYTYQAEE